MRGRQRGAGGERERGERETEREGWREGDRHGGTDRVTQQSHLAGQR